MHTVLSGVDSNKRYMILSAKAKNGYIILLELKKKRKKKLFEEQFLEVLHRTLFNGSCIEVKAPFVGFYFKDA